MGNDASADRREYFRVDDHIHLQCKALEPAAARSLADQLAAGGACSQIGELRALSAQMSTSLATIRKRDPELAQYLAMLDRKVESVAKMVEEQRLGADLTPNAQVNVGAGGMLFPSDTPFETGTELALRLLFFPSWLCIRTVGRVVHSEPAPENSEGRFRIGVEFSAMGEESRDALIRHLTERQAALLRRRGRE
jgi:c-di-GMP-binding flagellar brake protein YcgR